MPDIVCCVIPPFRDGFFKTIVEVVERPATDQFAEQRWLLQALLPSQFVYGAPRPEFAICVCNLLQSNRSAFWQIQWQIKSDRAIFDMTKIDGLQGNFPSGTRSICKSSARVTHRQNTRFSDLIVGHSKRNGILGHLDFAKSECAATSVLERPSSVRKSRQILNAGSKRARSSLAAAISFSAEEK